MAFPSPSEKQAKVLWFSLTALALAIFLALLALLFFGVAWLIDRLGWSRPKAVGVSVAVIFVLGLPAATSLVVLDWMDSILI